MCRRRPSEQSKRPKRHRKAAGKAGASWYKNCAELRGPIIKAKPRGRALPHASETYINQKEQSHKWDIPNLQLLNMPKTLYTTNAAGYQTHTKWRNSLQLQNKKLNKTNGFLVLKIKQIVGNVGKMW